MEKDGPPTIEFGGLEVPDMTVPAVLDMPNKRRSGHTQRGELYAYPSASIHMSRPISIQHT